MAKLKSAWPASLVCEALGLPANMVRRLVVDYQPDGAVVVYVEMYADSSILVVTQTLEGVTINRESKAEEIPQRVNEDYLP